MNQEFIQFCSSRNAPLPLLVHEFRLKYPDFNVESFITWKREKISTSKENFFKFPFLRDSFFISYLKSQQAESEQNLYNFKKFILSAQASYYSKFVDSNFSSSHLLSQTFAKDSKCPFAAKNRSNAKSDAFALDRNLSISLYSIIEKTSISYLGFDDLTVNIVKSGQSPSNNAYIHIFLEGTHSNIKFYKKDGINIICSGSSFYESRLLSLSEMLSDFSNQVINEIISTKSVLTATDVRFLFGSKIIILDKEKLDLVLNVIVYLNFYGLPITADILKTQGIESNTCGPSLLEPYKDLLTVDYIKKNQDLFQ